MRPVKLLVVFHIYYESQVEYYLSKMGNICDCEWDLVCSGHNLSDQVKAKILAFKADASFVEVPNVGYDVWPFIFCMKTLNPSDYDIVIKLHTKNEDGKVYRLHGKRMDGAGWRNALVEPLLGNAARFASVLRSFEQNPNLGITYSQQLNYESRGGNLEDGKMLEDELRRLGIERKSSSFVAGTMFAASGRSLAFLKDEKISEEIFDHSGPTHGCATMAHVYERLVPIAVVSAGYDLKLIPSSRWSAIRFAIRSFTTPVFSWIASVDYYSKDHRKCLKIFGFLISLE